MLNKTQLSITLLLISALMLFPSPTLFAREDASANQDFIATSFAQDPPKAALLWITRPLKPAIRDILGHDLNRLRLRYWRRGTRSAWILEEIGKERLITFGIVIDNNRIVQLRVIAFRESRGWEIRHPFFTDQFNGATMTDRQRLDRHIDNISGATLSVRAATRIARLALFLHQQTAPKIGTKTRISGP